MTTSFENTRATQTSLNGAFPFGTMVGSIDAGGIKQTGGTSNAHRHSAKWRDSRSICCFADGERHLGHIVRAGSRWLAFFGTRYNDTANGFRLLGICLNIAAAKCTVERGHPVNRECPGAMQ
jgi:hypothetical protein